MGAARVSLTIALVLPLWAQNANPAGTITGRVVDASGTPVKAAGVYVLPLGRPLATRTPSATADDAGAFVIDHLEFGTYGVYGMKEDQGYPNTLFFSQVEAPRVTISAQQPSGTVVLRFGPKAGMITGTARDERTGKPVPAGGGNLRTSSACPHPGPQNVYFFYSADGSTRAFPDNYWNGSGILWGEYSGVGVADVVAFGFFVGSGDEYVKATSR